jgi:hypothetical protein
MNERSGSDAMKLLLIAVAGTIIAHVGVYAIKRYLERADPDSLLGRMYQHLYGEYKYRERDYDSRHEKGWN